jgi:membrane-bound serine protease (ClpP class)
MDEGKIMKTKTLLSILGICWLLFAPLQVAGQAEQQVFILTLSGPLTPAMAEYLDRGIAEAAEAKAEAIILRLDTPGGQVDLMTRMIQSIRSSPVPIVVYVSPRGAIAGSAGTVITLAGHVAAMAPETAIGAASPVGGQGEDLGETIEKKQKEILKGQARSLASHRGEDAVALAEATIDEATAASAEEALQVGMIDFISNDLDQLLDQIDGLQVELADREVSLATADATRRVFEASFIEELLQTLTNPNIIFILITIGVQAILIEISNPGGWVAGFIGVVCLALGIYGLGVLPVNWFGLIFVATAFVLFLLEVKAPTHGALSAAGVGSLIVGALVLFNSPGTPDFFRVSVPLVIATAVLTALLFITIVAFAVRAQRRRIAVGAEALIGKVGIARTELKPRGMVQVGGELWSAELIVEDQQVPVGGKVKIQIVEGLRLLVEPEE